MNNNENTMKSKSPKTVTGKMNSDIVIPSFLIQEEGMHRMRKVMCIIALVITAVIVATVYRRNRI